LASVSFSVQAQVAKKLDIFGRKEKLGSRTTIIDYMLIEIERLRKINRGIPMESMIYFDQNGEPINEFLEYLNSENLEKPN
jgi:hypothetical protein